MRVGDEVGAVERIVVAQARAIEIIACGVIFHFYIHIGHAVEQDAPVGSVHRGYLDQVVGCGGVEIIVEGKSAAVTVDGDFGRVGKAPFFKLRGGDLVDSLFGNLYFGPMAGGKDRRGFFAGGK